MDINYKKIIRENLSNKKQIIMLLILLIFLSGSIFTFTYFFEKYLKSQPDYNNKLNIYMIGDELNSYINDLNSQKLEFYDSVVYPNNIPIQIQILPIKVITYTKTITNPTGNSLIFPTINNAPFYTILIQFKPKDDSLKTLFSTLVAEITSTTTQPIDNIKISYKTKISSINNISTTKNFNFSIFLNSLWLLGNIENTSSELTPIYIKQN